MSTVLDDRITETPFKEFLEQVRRDNETGEANDFYSKSGDSPPLGMLWGQFRKCKFAEASQIVFGIRRGNVGLLIAETNVGKTTMALNVALTLAANGTFTPIINEPSGTKRVMYIDSESTRTETQNDITRMVQDWFPDERAPLDENLLILCDEEINGEALNLSDEKHFERVREIAEEFEPALIVVDTLAPLFSLHDENSNAEINKTVMQPLKSLAKKSNSAVLLLHHIGKPKGEEGSTRISAYKGRGASNLGCLSRSVIALSYAEKNDRNKIVLSMVKAKGYHFKDVVMRLDEDSRWFSATKDVPPTLTCAMEIISLVNKEMKTAEIVKALSQKYKKRTIEDGLNSAKSQGLLHTPKKGVWQPIQTTESALPNEAYVSVETGKQGNGFAVDDDGRLLL